MAGRSTNRAAKMWRCACLAVLVSCVSGASFAVGPDTQAGASDDKSSSCLGGPKGAAPSGERWYYRVERGTKRHCWYTRADTSRTVATQASAPEATKVSDPVPAAPLQPSVANARAEAAPSNFPPPSTFGTPPDKIPAVTGSDAQDRTLADRWSDHPNADQSTPSRPATVALPTPQTPAKPSTDDQGYSLWKLLIVIGGALALVSGAIGLITKFARPKASSRSGDVWSSAQWDDDHGTETSPPLSLSDDEPPMNWVRIAREEADKRDDEIERLLTRQARPG